MALDILFNVTSAKLKKECNSETVQLHKLVTMLSHQVFSEQGSIIRFIDDERNHNETKFGTEGSCEKKKGSRQLDSNPRPRATL